jgi:MHS family proline/betaine transporter-like MFS transporter
MNTKQSRVKAISAASIGNVVEWFDFSVYGYFASLIAINFFVTDNELTSLLATFAVFAVGFFMRPLGAVIIGNYGDKFGRKKALAFTVIMMAAGTFIVGILPTYDQIGIWAPILIVLARLIQGFSAGGEWGGSASFMVEYADESNKGFWGSWQQVSTATGLLLGSFAGLILTNTMSPSVLEAWGWRIPFLLGGVLGLFGLYLRAKVDESPVFESAKEKGKIMDSPLKETLKNYKKEVLLGLGFTVFWTSSYYGLLTYMPSYIINVLHLSKSLAFTANTISIVALIIMIPIMGSLSDRVGRKPVLLTATVSAIILTYPLFLMISTGSFTLILIALITFSAIIALYSGAGVAAISEIYPMEIRYTALSIGYNVATAVFGGTAPFISTYLISVTGSNLSPAFYIIASAVVTTFVIFGITFSAKTKQLSKTTVTYSS